MPLNKTPAEFQELTTLMIEYVSEALRLGEHGLMVRYKSLKNATADNEVNHAYDFSRLRFDSQQFGSEHDLFSTVIHELLHSLTGPLLGYQQLVLAATEKPQRRVLKEAYRQADELVTVRLERVLCRLLWPEFERRHLLPSPPRHKK